MKPTKEIVSREGNLHFRRWTFLRTPWFSAHVHCIYRSDEDHDPHDHPWWFTSLVLKGGYIERVWSAHSWVKDCVRRPGSIAARSTSTFHKIKLLNGPTWTLVVTGKRTHDLWGYRTRDGWMDHKTYRRCKNKAICK